MLFATEMHYELLVALVYFFDRLLLFHPPMTMRSLHPFVGFDNCHATSRCVCSPGYSSVR